MFNAIRRLFDPRARLREALGKENLPSFSAVQMQVLKSLRSPDTALSAIGHQLASDPGLSTKVLRTVNSAAFGLGRKVSDPAHAAALLGRAELESLVLSVATRHATPSKSISGFDPNTFWRTASRRAATARLLADRVSPRERGVCFTAGLLQDMAVPLLAAARPDTYGPLVEQSRGGPGLIALEREVLGMDHAEVAGWLCENWSFPEPLSAAITGHHGEPGAAPIAVQIVALITDQSEPEATVEAARDTLNLSPEELLHILEDGAIRGDEMAQALLG